MVASYARAGAPRRQESFTRADFLRRLALASLSVGVTADVLNACSGAALKPSGSTTPSMAASPNGAVQLPASTQATPATGAVRLLMPGGGIDRAVLKAFRRHTGVDVRVVAPPQGMTLPEALSRDALCDVVLVPDHLVPVLGGQRLLRPLEMTLVGNFDYVQGAFRSPPYDEGDPVRFSVPFQFRTLGLHVRPDALDAAPRAWSDLWQPRFRRRVRIAVRGHSVVSIGLLSLGFSVGSTDRHQVDLAVARLIALKPNLRKPGADTHGAPVTVCWSSQAMRAARTTMGRGLRFVLPAEGFEIDTDALCVARTTPNPVAAHRFLDFCLRPRVQRGVARRSGTQSAEPEAWMYLPPLERSFATGDPQLVHGQWLGDLGSAGAAVYDRAWETVAREWGMVA